MEAIDVIVVGELPVGSRPPPTDRQEADLGLGRWWTGPSSVEHACEVGLLPEASIG